MTMAAGPKATAACGEGAAAPTARPIAPAVNDVSTVIPMKQANLRCVWSDLSILIGAWMHGWTSGWLAGKMDVQMDARIDEWLDGWMTCRESVGGWVVSLL